MALPLPPSSVDHGRATARGVVAFLGLRGITILGGLVCAILVPRLMGPATYGRYALMTSLALWVVAIASFGMINVIAREVPALAVREPSRLAAFLGNLLALRLASGAVAGVVYFSVTTVWLKDLASSALLLLGASVFVHVVASFVFATFLGFNRPGRWAAADSLRRWLSLALIVPAFVLGGLTGACAAVLASEVILLGFGAWWGRSWLTRVHLKLDLPALAPYLRLGLGFYATQQLYMALCASGEPMVRTFSGDYAEVGYFALAHAMYLAAAGAMSQLTLLFVPLLGDLLARGDVAAGRRSIERLLTWLVVGGVIAVLASVLLGETVVALVLGPGYAPVAANLVPLCAALLMFGFSSVTGTLALVHDRPRPAVIAAGLRLLVFWSVGSYAVAGHGAWGCSLAVAVATAAHLAWLGWSLRDTLTGAIRTPLMAAALGALFLPLVWLRAFGVADGLLFLALIAAYGVVLFRTGVLKGAELKMVIDAVRFGQAAVAAPDGGGRRPTWYRTHSA